MRVRKLKTMLKVLENNHIDVARTKICWNGTKSCIYKHFTARNNVFKVFWLFIGLLEPQSTPSLSLWRSRNMPTNVTSFLHIQTNVVSFRLCGSFPPLWFFTVFIAVSFPKTISWGLKLKSSIEKSLHNFTQWLIKFQLAASSKVRLSYESFSLKIIQIQMLL